MYKNNESVDRLSDKAEMILMDNSVEKVSEIFAGAHEASGLRADGFSFETTGFQRGFLDSVRCKFAYEQASDMEISNF